jgi:hypothetical protein
MYRSMSLSGTRTVDARAFRANSANVRARLSVSGGDGGGAGGGVAAREGRGVTGATGDDGGTMTPGGVGVGK